MGFTEALRKKIKILTKAAILGQVSGEKRNQRTIAHIGIQEHKNPTATMNSIRVRLVSLTELFNAPLLVLFCNELTTFC